MRIYTYATKRELINIAANGLIPQMPQSSVNKLIQDYLDKHPKYVDVGRKHQIQVSTKAVYGGLVSSALNLYTKMTMYPDGEILFVNIRETLPFPALAFNYEYRIAIHSLLLMKEESPSFNKDKFKTVKDAIMYYVAAYVNSAHPLKGLKEYIRSKAYRSYEDIDKAYSVRKIAEQFEVLIYQPIAPEYIYVKGQRKGYMAFMDWMYAHRGLFKYYINEAKDVMEKSEIQKKYNEFMKRYRRFMALRAKGAKVPHTGVIVYVPPRFES